jgi:hypothetical protein
MLKDYLLGKFLRLIYLCLYQTRPDDKELLNDCLRYAYFYRADRINSEMIDKMSVEYLESLVGPESSEKTDD